MQQKWQRLEEDGSKMAEKVKQKTDSSVKKVPLSTKITTILIITLSILSVVAIVFIYIVQSDVKAHTDMADKWSAMIEVVESEANEILEADTQKQRMALDLQQEMLFWNDWIIQMKNYSKYVVPGLYNQSDIDAIVMQIVAQIEINNDLIKSTYAYNWTEKNGGGPGNNYLWYMWITDKYSAYLPYLDENVSAWINASFAPDTPEILLIQWFNWEFEPLWNASIELTYGAKTAYYANKLGLDIAGRATFEMSINIEIYEENASLLNDVIDSMTSGLLLMTIAAVILAFVVNMEAKKYIWISLIAACVVSAISISMFVSGVMYHLENQMFIGMSLPPI